MSIPVFGSDPHRKSSSVGRYELKGLCCIYRQFTAFLLTAPFAYFSRIGAKPCFMGWKNFWLIFLLSFIGVTANQNMYFTCIWLHHLPPVHCSIWYLLSLLSWLIHSEKVDLRSLRSVAKIIGTMVCVSGAAAMTLLKGHKLLNMEFQPTNSLVLSLRGGHDHDTWLLGCLLLLGSASCWSLWLILQVRVSASYPDHLSLTAWMCLMASIQSGFTTLIVEPNMNAWKLNSYFQVFCFVFAGLVSAITFFAQAWCIAMRGPLFSAMFNPLSTIIVTALACIFLNEELYVGSLMGGLAVIIGLYIVLWSKAKDYQETKEKMISRYLVKQNDQVTLCSDQFSDSTSSNVELEKPLLPENQHILTMYN